MATISNSIDILKTDSPQYEFFAHMNRLYLLIDMNNDCFRGQDFSYMSIAVTSYREDSDGNLDYENPITVWARDFQRYQIVDRFQDEGFPPYNIWTNLTNHWYGVSLSFSFQYNVGSGALPFESKRTEFTFDNRKTILTGQQTSTFFTGHLRDHLQKNKEFNIWFGIDPIIKKEHDIIADKKGTRFRQITWVNPLDNDNFQAQDVLPYFLHLIKSILVNKRTPDIFLEYFGETAPDPNSQKAIFTFRLKINNSNSWVHFRGDLQFMIDKALQNKGGSSGG